MFGLSSTVKFASQDVEGADVHHTANVVRGRHIGYLTSTSLAPRSREKGLLAYFVLVLPNARRYTRTIPYSLTDCCIIYASVCSHAHLAILATLYNKCSFPAGLQNESCDTVSLSILYAAANMVAADNRLQYCQFSLRGVERILMCDGTAANFTSRRYLLLMLVTRCRCEHSY